MNKLVPSWLRRVYVFLVFLLAFNRIFPDAAHKTLLPRRPAGVGLVGRFLFSQRAPLCSRGIVSGRGLLSGVHVRHPLAVYIPAGFFGLVASGIAGLNNSLRRVPCAQERTGRVFWDRWPFLSSDMVHLGAVILLGVVAVGVLFAGRPSYLKRKQGFWE